MRHGGRTALVGLLLGIPAVTATMASSGAAGADPAAVRISTDSFTNTSSQHATELEPDTFAYGSTIVAAFQSGRFYDGGSSDIAWATSADAGSTWTSGVLPGTTVYAGGTFDRVSDPSVAYDARHGRWLVSSLALQGTGGAGVLVSSGGTDGSSWSDPVVVSAQSGPDKEWIVCDDSSTSPYFGNCYVQWDNNAQGNRIYMSTSTDGGLTWGGAMTTSGSITGIGGQPVVQPDGTVVVPLDTASEGALGAFESTDGGASWGPVTTITGITSHRVAGGLRTSPLPSAGVDGAGNVYVAWQDCRFRSGCAANDIVMTRSPDGAHWGAVTRVPTGAATGSEDDFIPGLAVDPSSAGSAGRLALTYYFYPSASCTSSTCQLEEGFIASSDGGQDWGAPQTASGPMALTSLASTNQGYMVGDYQSASFVGSPGVPVGVFAVGGAPSGSTLNEAMYAFAGTMPAAPSPDFSLALSPSSATVTDGHQVTYTLTATPSGGFSDPVALSASGLPSGATTSFNPGSTTSTSTLTITTSGGLAANSYPFTVTGAGGGLSHSVGGTLVVQAAGTPGYTLSVTPASRTINQGQNTSYKVTINRTKGFTQSVTLAVTGLPGGSTATWKPNPATTSSTLTIHASATSDTGTFTLVISGDTSSGQTQSATAALTVRLRAAGHIWNEPAAAPD
ncbi:MAG TPA: sialidase family protein [Acidimicrobiales bacterium]|nr:sialidase family protein [Acidimicrobiales bacterium]